MNPKHEQELKESCILDEIIDLNFRTIEEGNEEALDLLLSSPSLKRNNAGRVERWVLEKYGHCWAGGWWCSGINVTGEYSEWGCFKPDEPRINEEKGKPIKYEHPPKVPTEIFALRIPVATWQQISKRFNVPLPDNYHEVKENPWLFWKWVIDNPKIPLIITEGAKKAACILSQGFVAIALPGIFGGYRTPKNKYGDVIGKSHLISQAEVFATKGREIYFCFDQDEKEKTIRNVNTAISKTAKLFIQHGCKIFVITWGEKILDKERKGIDDLLYAYHEVYKWAKEQATSPEAKMEELFQDALDFRTWEGLQLKKLTYPVDLELNQRYLGELQIPHDAQIIAIKAPKGTGKTYSLAEFVAPYLKTGEKKILLLTHRIQLSTQTADRLGIPYITEARHDPTAKYFGMGMCIDSLHPKSQAQFKPEDWKNCIVIVDEVMQVIWHLLSSSTCVKDRVAIIRTLKELLQNVVKNGGKILVSDADLNDVGIDFLEGIIEIPVKRYIIENKYKFDEPWEIFRFQSNDARRLIGLLKSKLSQDEKHLLCVSGQKTKSRWGSIDLEAYFKKHLPHLRILRADAETVANPKHPAYQCGNRINEVIKEYDLVIATTTLETGVSIEEKHFQGVWGIFQGVGTADSVRQFLSRYRVPVPRYLWVKNTGIGFVGNKSNNYKALIASQKQLDKANRNRLIDCGFEENIDGSFEPIALTTWAKLGATINQGMWNYADTVLADLKEEGHHITQIAPDDETLFIDEDNIQELPSESEAESIKTEIDLNRDQQYEQHRKAVAAAESIDDKKFEKLKKQQVRTDEEILQLRKGRLERRYEVGITPDLVLKDDDGWYSRIKLYYYFTCGREFLPSQDKESMRSLLVEKDYFVVDTNNKLIGKKIDVFDYLGISRLYQETHLHKEHPIITDIFQKCQQLQNTYNFKLVLGVDLSNITPIQCVQILLGLIGHKMPYIKKANVAKKRINIYGTPAASFVMDNSG
ncbi:MAG: plasmid replication protein, CyRepA1 family, partial [Cyanobacteria bacterium J06633_8]